MTIVHVGGVDPGLVHTGVVEIHMDNHEKTLRIRTTVVDGDDADAVKKALTPGITVFIEKYEDRGTVFSTHGEMRKLEVKLNQHLGHAKLLSNTGVKKIVTPEMLKCFGLWDVQTTHHRDLQAAARIAIQGALKVPEWNSVIYGFLIDELAGRSWARHS